MRELRREEVGARFSFRMVDGLAGSYSWPEVLLGKVISAIGIDSGQITGDTLGQDSNLRALIQSALSVRTRCFMHVLTST